MIKLQMEYLDPQSARQFDFYMIPKMLIDSELFDGIDFGAKTLYSLMLSRASLSATRGNDYVDKDGHLYIIFTLEDMMKQLRISNKTAVKFTAQLSDCGLIERKKQGQGKPALIYVKNFATACAALESSTEQDDGDAEKPEAPAEKVQDCTALESLEKQEGVPAKKLEQPIGDSEKAQSDAVFPDMNILHVKTCTSEQSEEGEFEPFQTCKKYTSGHELSTRPDVKNVHGSYNNSSYNDFSKNNLSYLFSSDEMREIVCEQLEYDVLLAKGIDRELLENFVALMIYVNTSTQEYVQLGGDQIQLEDAKRMLKKIDNEAMENVIERFSKKTDKINNVPKYMLSMLLNEARYGEAQAINGFNATFFK